VFPDHGLAPPAPADLFRARKTVVLPVSERNIDATSHREILRESDYAG